MILLNATKVSILSNVAYEMDVDESFGIGSKLERFGFVGNILVQSWFRFTKGGPMPIMSCTSTFTFYVNNLSPKSKMWTTHNCLESSQHENLRTVCFAHETETIYNFEYVTFLMPSSSTFLQVTVLCSVGHLLDTWQHFTCVLILMPRSNKYFTRLINISRAFQIDSCLSTKLRSAWRNLVETRISSCF